MLPISTPVRRSTNAVGQSASTTRIGMLWPRGRRLEQLGSVERARPWIGRQAKPPSNVQVWAVEKAPALHARVRASWETSMHPERMTGVAATIDGDPPGRDGERLSTIGCVHVIGSL